MFTFDYQKFVEAWTKFIDWMTLSKMFKSILLACVLMGMYAVWENRTPIYKGIVTFNPAKTMIQAPLAETTIKAVTELLSKPANIIAVQLISVDFRTNSRKTEYFKSTNPAMQKIMDDYAVNKIGDSPFFTDDTKNNQRNTALINGDFTCYNLTEIAVFGRVPALATFATTVCSVSIPPYPGYFSGYINVYLTSVPTDTEKQDIRAAIRKLSLVTFDAEFPK